LAGWNLATLTSSSTSDVVDHYILDLSQGSTIVTLAATLTWQRANDQQLANEFAANANNPNFSQFTSPINSINNLDLFLYNVTTQTQVDLSHSSIDNVEQLYTLNLTPGKYDIQVLKNGGNVGGANVFSNSETYALAWRTQSISGVTNVNNLQFTQSNAVSISTTISGGGTITQNGSGTLTLAAYQGTGPLVVNAGRMVIASTSAAQQTPGILVATSGLTIKPGTTLDITNHDMVIQGSDIATIEQLISSGFNSGDWSGTGITSSTAASDPRGMSGLGVLTADDYMARNGTDIFDGTTVVSGEVLVHYGYYGDLDFDGVITGNDFFYMNYAKLHNLTGFANGDIDYDGSITGNDFFYLNYAKLHQDGGGMLGAMASGPAASLGAAATPEPSSLLVLGTGLLTVMLLGAKRVAR